VKTVAGIIGVSRSNLAEQTRKHPLESPAARKPYAKAGDVAVLPVIRRLVDQQPTYGYRRITALLNRERRDQGLTPVNRKRVLRIMQVNGLVLTRHTAYRPARTHDGHRHRATLQHPLVLGPSRTQMPQRRYRPHSLRHRCLRPRDHRLVGRRPWRRFGRDGA